MSRISIILATVVAAFSMVSCNMEISTPESPVSKKAVILASTEEGQTRTALSGDDTNGYDVIWTSGDSFKIGVNIFTLTDGENTTSGKFEGNVPSDGDYTVYYPSSYDGKEWPLTQTYVEGNITGSPMSASVTVAGGEVSAPISFRNEGGILRLTVKAGESLTIGKVVLNAIGLCAPITLDCGDGAAITDKGTDFHIAIPAGEYESVRIKFFTTDGKSFTKTMTSSTLVIERSMITTASFASGVCTDVEDCISGLFSVSDTKTVRFSTGNLYWDGDSFEFEADQLFFARSWTPSHVSHFFWSKYAAAAYDKSSNNAVNNAAEDDVFFTDIPGFTVNGQTDIWRTLTAEEWQYLLGDFDNPNYLWACVKGVNGLIIFCDGYTGPKTGLVEIPEGCVFLPAAGCRSATTGVSVVGEVGYYSSSTLKNKSNAFDLYFEYDYEWEECCPMADDDNGRAMGQCIRLVKE